MQVSRAVVNGGLAELAAQGFVEIRPRQGTFVADYRRNGNLSTLIAILEVRRALEQLAVGLILRNATDEDIERLGDLVAHIAGAQTPQQAAERAFEFQHELALISGNSILPLFYYSYYNKFGQENRAASSAFPPSRA